MTADEQLRADARANRDRILEVAREALAKDPQASLNSIAKAAGIGPGTLYRHFPDRESLVLGVYRKEIASLVALAPVLLARHPPLHAFRTWCDRLAKLGRVKHGLADTLNAAKSEEDFKQTYWPMLGAVQQLLDACKSSGDVDPDSNGEDLLVLLGFLWRIPPTSVGEARVQRLLALVFRGLGAKDAAR